MLNSVRLEIVLIWTQHRCTDFAECTTGSEIILDAPNGLLVDVGLVESHFCPFGGSASVGAR
jgi:hypothetical protein